MRTKQSAIRRLANSDDEDETAAAASPLPSPEPQPQPQPPPTVVATTINGDGQQQLEDGTVVVQPEAAEATDDNQVGCFDQAASGARCTAPGIYDTIKCTACAKRVNPYNGTMEVHPMLKVLVCHKCYRFYASGHFDADEEGKENQCRWCGEGGSLICCDNCEHSFCRTCIKRNLGRSALQDIESLPEESVWLCYGCDQGALRHLQEEASIVMKAVRDHFKEVNKRSEKQKVSQAKKAVSQPQHSQQQQLQQQFLQQQQQLQQQLQQKLQHQRQLNRPAAVPVLVNAATAAAVPAIAYGSIRGGVGVANSNSGGSATIAGMQLDLSAVPKVATRMPQQLPLQPHRQQHNHHNHHHLLQQQPQQQQHASTVPSGGASSVTQRTEQWYKQNVRIETILADIESVDARNIGTALNATVSLLQGMMRQYSRFMQDLTTAATPTEKTQIVSRFKSAYRMHLFLRLGKLRSLIVEEDKHLMRKSAAGRAGLHAAASSAVIDLTGSAPANQPVGAARQPQAKMPMPPLQPGLQLPLPRTGQHQLAPHPPQHPQHTRAQVLRPPRQRQEPRVSATTSVVAAAPAPVVPPELIVVLSDDDDDDDENNNNNNNGNNGEANHVAAEDKVPEEVGAAEAIAADASAAASAGLSVVSASVGGGKPAAILELLEARRRREKSARKTQQPRRIAAPADAAADADADADADEPVENDAAEEAAVAAEPEPELDRPASSPSSPASASAAGTKRHLTEEGGADCDVGGDGDVGGGGAGGGDLETAEVAAPPSEKRPRQQSEEPQPEPPTPPPPPPPPLDEAAAATAATATAIT